MHSLMNFCTMNTLLWLVPEQAQARYHCVKSQVQAPSVRYSPKSQQNLPLDNMN